MHERRRNATVRLTIAFLVLTLAVPGSAAPASAAAASRASASTAAASGPTASSRCALNVVKREPGWTSIEVPDFAVGPT
ncbi:MAG TPA: hypothetical protein VFK89_10125, partial [Actinomycetota bacterium]|nr:hypothetical protein [Actinomycetota bacterium]